MNKNEPLAKVDGRLADRHSAAAAEWGIPDWRDPAAYGAADSWTDHRWRWEFTRRRADYRADFDQYAAASYALALESVTGGKVLKPNDPGFVATMPGPLKYGLAGLPNPRISDQPIYVRIFRSAFGGAYLGEGKEFLAGGAGINIDAPEGTMAVVFDLAHPIEAQLREWRSCLEVSKIKFTKRLSSAKNTQSYG